MFATLTAPSFGLVHGTRGGRTCRPFTAKGQDRTCEHGRATVCHATARRRGRAARAAAVPGLLRLPSHLVWQWWAPELWRRFTIDLRRALARHLGVPESRLAELVTVQYAKVAEYQQRGIVHFHALIRLDGPKTVDGFAPAPAGLTAALLLPGSSSRPPPGWSSTRRRCTTGTWCAGCGSAPSSTPDRSPTARRTDDPDRALTPEQVAGYLAKYATKSATDSTDTDSPHARRLRATIARGRPTGSTPTHAATASRCGSTRTGCCGKWRHMLGFRGHFSTKSRRYSVTLGQLRRRRVRYERALAAANREGRTLDVRDLDDLLPADVEETTLVIGQWTYAGTGWDTDGDAELAKAAAARAREYAQWKAAQKANSTSPQVDRSRGEGQ